MSRFRTWAVLLCALPLPGSPQKLIFEPNQGQASRQVRWLVRGGARSLRVTSAGVIIRAGASAADEIRLRLEGAAAFARGQGVDPTGGHSNYFRGNDPGKWRTGVPHYRAVRFHRVYDGIDMALYSEGRDVEFDLIVRPGADAGRIRFAYDGARRIDADAAGDLVLTTAAGTRLKQRRPLVYQDIAGERVEVAADYRILGDRRAGIRFGPYDPTAALVVDPVLMYSTFLGGSDKETPAGIAVDAAGSAYVLGTSDSDDYPTRHAMQNRAGNVDLVVTKLAPGGNDIVYSTYIGGSGWELPGDIVVDKSGNAFVAAATRSTDFPTRGAIQRSHAGGRWDAVILKIAPEGDALAYSTYLGGSLDDEGTGIALDSAGSAYVAGYSNSPNLPTVSAYQTSQRGDETFVAKLSPAGDALRYLTYVGGDGAEWPWHIAVDTNGAAYVTGYTTSTRFPTVSAYQSVLKGDSDVFVYKLAPNGRSLEYSTYLGTADRDDVNGIVVDSAGSAYIAGATWSSDFPTVPAAVHPAKSGVYAFVAKLTPTGNQLAYSVLLGGKGSDYAYDVAVDGSGNAWVAGSTNSRDFPVVSAEQTTNRGFTDAFLAKLDATGNVAYSSYFGSSGYDNADAIAIDGSGSVYVVGYTEGGDGLPVVNPFQSRINDYGPEMFVAKFAQTVPGIPVISEIANVWSGLPVIADAGWAYIKGANLASTTRVWREDDIKDGQLPESLEGVRVTVNNLPAHVHYVSPGQINIQVPDDGQTGSVPVKVATDTGATATFNVQKAPIAPSIFVWPPGVATEGGTYAGAVAVENQKAVYIGRTGLLSPVGITTRPARPGEVVVFFLTGCGPTTPATPAGVTVGSPVPTLATPVEARINGFPAQLAGNTGYLIFPGECQFNVTIPAASVDGDLPVEFSIGGARTQPYVYVTVKR